MPSRWWIRTGSRFQISELRARFRGCPAIGPDADRNGKHFVFVHGYNVSGDASQGWHSEIFKRLYWSGSEAMFTGISWEGNQTQIPGTTITPDYWSNVTNAFQTSESVSRFTSLLPGDKTIAAHSLGNMVVSSAIADHDLEVENYFMIDAAVAMEAYESASTDLMKPDSWDGYLPRLWPTHWHELFDPATDGRSGLTWRQRFGAFPNAYNFYSSGENVLKNGTGQEPTVFEILGQRAWVKQEMSKGRSDLAGGGLTHAAQGGWVFNHDADPTSPYAHYNPINGHYTPYSQAEANAIPSEQLKLVPFFKAFNNVDITDPGGRQRHRRGLPRTRPDPRRGDPRLLVRRGRQSADQVQPRRGRRPKL